MGLRAHQASDLVWDFAQTVCLHKRPECSVCPLRRHCAWFASSQSSSSSSSSGVSGASGAGSGRTASSLPAAAAASRQPTLFAAMGRAGAGAGAGASGSAAARLSSIMAEGNAPKRRKLEKDSGAVAAADVVDIEDVIEIE